MSRQVFICLLVIFSLALMANALWLAELLLFTGWEGPGWLWSPQYSAYGVVALLVLAFLTPVHRLAGVSLIRLFLPGLELFLTGVVGFLIGKTIMYTLQSPVLLVNLSQPFLLGMLLVLAFLSAGSFYLVLRRYFFPVQPLFLLLMVVAEGAALTLGWLTVRIFPGFGPPAATQVVDAVKMGYPFFWITLLFGLLSLYTVMKLRRATEKTSHEEILDDMEFPADQGRGEKR